MPHSQPLRHSPPSAHPKVDKLLQLRHSGPPAQPKVDKSLAMGCVTGSCVTDSVTEHLFLHVFSSNPFQNIIIYMVLLISAPQTLRKRCYLHAFSHFRNLPKTQIFTCTVNFSKTILFPYFPYQTLRVTQPTAASQSSVSPAQS